MQPTKAMRTMRISRRGNERRKKRGALHGTLRAIPKGFALLASCGWLIVAHAGLGEPVASVARDGATIRASSMKTTAMPMYDRHDLTTDDGTSVQEFVAHDGTVFAVAFNGPALPDLKSVLGTHYETYVAAARAHRGNHHVMSFEADGVVVTIVKQQRGFVGSARVPASVPSGVTLQELRP